MRVCAFRFACVLMAMAAVAPPADAKKLRGTVVIANLEKTGGKYIACRTIRHGDMYIMIYRPVFGPASRAAARRFIALNCR